MKIFYWAASMEDGTYLYRVKLPGDALAARGHEVRTSQRPGVWTTEEADIIVGHRVAVPGVAFLWQRLRDEGRARLVYEIDDDLLAINLITNPMAGHLRNAEARKSLIACAANAHLVTVSTEPLARVMREFNDNVVVVPNALPDGIFDVPLSTLRGRNIAPPEATRGSAFTLGSATPRGVVMLGWHGSFTHELDWEVARQAVVGRINAHPNVVMRFLGTAYPAGIPHGKWNARRWTTDLNLHYRRVAAFDIGLAPLRRGRFEASKSGLKFMEYAALGVPAICSRVPAYQAVVEHGVTGFLADTPAEWSEYLELLITDPELRIKMGDTARVAARRWAISERVTNWENAYLSLLGGSGT